MSNNGLRLTEQVVLKLRELILNGDLKAGERAAEIPLSEMLGVSRTPVREALTVLAQEGLLTLSGKRGYQVNSFTLKDIEDAIDVRGVLEGTGARLVAENGPTAELLAALESCLEEGEKIVSKTNYGAADDVLWVEMNGRFHRMIMEACGNRPLLSALSLNDKLPFASAEAVLGGEAHSDEIARRHQETMILAQRDHRLIVAALRQRQGSRVEALMREHARRALLNVELFKKSI